MQHDRSYLDRAWASHLGGEAMPPPPSTNLTDVWLARWRARPDDVVLLHDGQIVTADEIEARSADVAARLAEAGATPGDRVLLAARTSVDLVTTYVGLLRGGFVVVPVNTAYRAREVAHVLTDATPRAAIVDDPEMAGWIRRSDPGIVVTTPALVGLPQAHGPAPGLDGAQGDDVAMICYTSGTTGSPKGAMLLHRNLLASAESLRVAWRWTPEDRLILTLPLFHLHGLGVGLNGTFTAGASILLQDRFDPELVLGATDQASMFFGVPTMYRRLADHPDVAELRSLRLCVSGSAPLPADLHQRVHELAGQHILERYGMTETVMNVSHPYDGERKPGTVGLPLPGVEIALAEGRSGEVMLRGPNVFPGYWRNDQATREAFTHDGWFRSGDVGELDEEGYLRLVGRAKELIISGGYNVYPREVEDVLRSVPDVVDAAVVGTPSDEWGEVVTAFVVGDVDDEAIVSVTTQMLAPYKQPRIIHHVRDLPRNALGKVLKHELRPASP